MSNWVPIASAADFPSGTAHEFVAGGRVVALFHVDGQFFAMDGICPHQGGPLGKGKLNGCVLTCPWHGWQFDVRNGQHQVNPALRHPTFPVRVEGDTVFVDIEG